jgi:glycine/D-amino acid oxidase-like deaminating enzyme
MRLAVLGAGLQGCCAALALAERGASVVLYDKRQTLLGGAATANEGKIHLGYMYANDPTLATARIMIEGALAFAPFMERYLGLRIDEIKTSAPANYAIHRESQRSPAMVSGYLHQVHELVSQAAVGRRSAYFGANLLAPLREWQACERDALFNPDLIAAAFQTPELAIDPTALANVVGNCIRQHPRIHLNLGHKVFGVAQVDGRISVTTEAGGACSTETFDQVVNALWDGRLAVDATIGLHPHRRWLHRLKYGVTLRLPNGMVLPPSVTCVSGPFGEVVSFPNRDVYLTWYPACVHGMSDALAPPDWPTDAADPERSQILTSTVSALCRLIPSLAPLQAASLEDVRVKGGVIVAWGETDIYDPRSALHGRYDIGLRSLNGYHSLNPGKLTMAPYFAEQCAERIFAGTSTGSPLMRAAAT